MNYFGYNRPNTRERIAARRRQMAPGRAGSAVTPMPRRVLSSWLRSGWVASLALALLAAYALYDAFTSPRFTVRQIAVTGTSVLDGGRVAELAGVRGLPIWFVDTGQIAARLRGNPYIEDASAEAQLPDRVTITLTERRPELRWQSGGTRYLVDAQGLVLGVESTAALSGTLAIDDRSNTPLEPGSRVDAGALALGRTLAVRLPRELKLTPAGVAWEPDKGILIVTPDRRTVIFGTSENLDNKLAVLGYLLQEGTPFTLLDLRPGTPYYRNDGGPQPTPAPTPVGSGE
jgi:cell division protein FtsQ